MVLRGAGSLSEKLHRFSRGQILGQTALSRQLERWDGKLPFPFHVERTPACREHLKPWTCLEQGGQIARGRQEMFKVVQYEEQRLVADGGTKPLSERLALVAYVERPGNR